MARCACEAAVAVGSRLLLEGLIISNLVQERKIWNSEESAATFKSTDSCGLSFTVTTSTGLLYSLERNGMFAYETNHRPWLTAQ